MLLKLRYDGTLSNYAFNFNLRRYIMLSIRSRHVPNLTLVDMPGLTKVATSDQPDSIVSEIEEMARAFITPPNVIIVAVSAANADIATSDGIRLAREVGRCSLTLCNPC